MHASSYTATFPFMLWMMEQHHIFIEFMWNLELCTCYAVHMKKKNLVFHPSLFHTSFRTPLRLKRQKSWGFCASIRIRVVLVQFKMLKEQSYPQSKACSKMVQKTDNRRTALIIQKEKSILECNKILALPPLHPPTVHDRSKSDHPNGLFFFLLEEYF